LKELRLVAPLHHNSGYAKAGRALLAAAMADGYTVEAVETDLDTGQSVFLDGHIERWQVPKFRSTDRPAVQEAELRQSLGNKVSKNAPTLILNPPHGLSNFPEWCGGPRIGLTMLEADTLNPLWAQAARNVDLLLAPSPWNVETLTRDVKGVCVQHFPLCVDERLWSPTGPKREVEKRPDFLFCSVFSTCERKGWRSLIQAFSEEFPGENVGLLLKPGRFKEVDELAQWACERGAWVEVVDEELTDPQMAEFYRAADCFVLPSAEGFGLTFVEAMMCGLPVIGLDKGGTEQIVTEENGYPIPSAMVPCVGQLPQIYRSDYRWPAAAVPDIRAAIRKAVSDGPGPFPRVSGQAVVTWGRGAIRRRLEKLVDYARSSFGYSSVCELPRSAAPAGVAVITTHNHLEATKRCVASLREHSPQLQIILADDCSTDGTVQWAADEKLRCYSLTRAPGNVSATREAMLELLRQNDDPPFVVFLDNDVEVSAGWWETLTGIMAANPEIGILAPRKVYKSSGRTQNVGNKLRLNGWSYPLSLSRPIVWCDYVETACMVIRPEVWQACHFDPQFPIFYEDTDFCMQARALGWEIAATADVTVIHDAHTTSTPRQDETELRRMAFLKKWKDML
jgi:GT2 family glycosyltransferase/glycosyltransferase involved in cell wall biosynthesis